MNHRIFCALPGLAAYTASAFLLFGVLVPDAEASFARKLSGKLSRNPSIATQQLTADPPQTVDGTISVFYDPALLSLYFPPEPATSESALFVDSPGFASSPRIGVLDRNGVPQFVDPGGFRDVGEPLTETGEIRVTFTRLASAASPVVLPPEAGYGPYVTEPGFVQGDDLFGAIFYERASYAPDVATDADWGGGPALSNVIADAPPVVSPFTLTVTPGQTIRVIEEGNTEPTTLGPTDVTPGVIAFPEPGGLGVLAVAGVALASRRWRRVLN